MLLKDLHKWEQTQPEKVALSFLDDMGNISASLTYIELGRRSTRLANYLVKVEQLPRGSRVILVYPPCLDFIVAFIACLKAGLIAVPVFPPDPNTLSKDLLMFAKVCENSGGKHALTNDGYNYATKIATIRDNFTGSVSWPDLTWIATDGIVSDAAYDISREVHLAGRQSSPNDPVDLVAFLQYTSGSTSDPKGAIISHSNLDHNIGLIHAGLRAKSDTVVVSWLPQYHDMGLIGSYLACMSCGGSGYYMSPVAFIRNPPLWIKCISKYRGTHMQAPDFAYGLTAKKFLAMHRDGGNSSSSKYFCSDIDLSCVRHMINAAEPVQRRSIASFEGVFRRHGLKPNVVFPTYGLAEHTVYVCSNGRTNLNVDAERLEDGVVHIIEEGDDRKKRVATLPGCGCPGEQVRAEIVIESDGVCTAVTSSKPARVGEVWIRSPSVAMGYWGFRKAPENDNFRGLLNSARGECDPQFFLRTGDLGFIHDGELVICGRKKDLIVIRGKNHFPQDIERTVEGICSRSDNLSPFLRPGCSAAFHYTSQGREGLGVVSELTDDQWVQFRDSKASITLDEVFAMIHNAITEYHGINPAYMAILKPRCVYKTTSGKISRSRVRKAAIMRDGSLIGLIKEWKDTDLPKVPGRGNSGSTFEVNVQKNLESFLDDEVDGFAPPLTVADPNSDIRMGRVDMREGGVPAIDPTNMPLDLIQDILADEVKAVLACKHGKERVKNLAVDFNAPVGALGIDSLMGVQLLGNLESRFTIPIPEKLCGDSDCTLRSVSLCLAAGGRFRDRSIMVDSWRAIDHMRMETKRGIDPEKLEELSKEGTECVLDRTVIQQWLNINSVKADLNTNTFPVGYVHNNYYELSAKNKTFESHLQWIWKYMAHDTFMKILRFFLVGLFLALVLKVPRWAVKLLIACIFLWIFNIPDRLFLSDSFIDAKNLVTLQCSRFLRVFAQFFNHRFVIEAPIDSKTPCIFLVQGTECVNRGEEMEFTSGTRIAQATTNLIILHSCVSYLFGFQTKTILPKFFSVDEDTYKAILKDRRDDTFNPKHSYLSASSKNAWRRCGFMGNFTHKEFFESETTFGDDGTLQHRPNLSLLYDEYDPSQGFVMDDKGAVGSARPNSNISAVRLALIKGYQLVPVLHMSEGNTESESRSGSRLQQTKMTCIVGRPIQCPRMYTSSAEVRESKQMTAADLGIVTDDLVQEYDDLYNKEIRRMVRQYSDIYIRDK